MIIVGLTGGIASGKSFVINYLKKTNIPTHESDIVVKNIYSNPTKEFFSFLKKNGFKKAILKNSISKAIVREEIFQNKRKKNILEKYIHNVVKKERSNFIKKNKKKKIVFLDIPLLFEKKLSSVCNYTCSTIAPIKKREFRALQRSGMTKKIFKLIIKNQTTDKERKLKSDYIINTNLTKSKTCLQVDNIIYDILKKKKERNSIRR